MRYDTPKCSIRMDLRLGMSLLNMPFSCLLVNWLLLQPFHSNWTQTSVQKNERKHSNSSLTRLELILSKFYEFFHFIGNANLFASIR